VLLFACCSLLYFIGSVENTSSVACHVEWSRDISYCSIIGDSSTSLGMTTDRVTFFDTTIPSLQRTDDNAQDKFLETSRANRHDWLI